MHVIARTLTVAALAALVSAPAAHAQRYQVFKEWSGWFHGGYMAPQGSYDDVTDDSWTIGGGLTYTPHSWRVGFDLGLDFHENNIDRSVANELDSDFGKVEIWALTAGARWRPFNEGPGGLYFRAGLSWNRVDARVSNQEWVPGWICDPWYWWWCYPGWVPGEVVNARYRTDELGYYGGLGYNFELSPTSSLYVEATYRVIDTVEETAYIPILIGFQF
jgi:opacity protein-like surface antigen